MADFNLDAKMQEQENNQGKVNTSAVDKAKRISLQRSWNKRPVKLNAVYQTQSLQKIEH